MIDPDGLRALAGYNRWMNDRLFDAAERLAPEARAADRGAFFGSIQGTLGHILLADLIWLRRLTGDDRHLPRDADGAVVPVRGLDTVLYEAWPELRRARRRVDDALTAWVDGLTAEALAGDVRYLRGDAPQVHPLWWAALHVFHHQTHHRGQVTTLLTQAGVDPGVTDLIAWLRRSPP